MTLSIGQKIAKLFDAQRVYVDGPDGNSVLDRAATAEANRKAAAQQPNDPTLGRFIHGMALNGAFSLAGGAILGAFFKELGVARGLGLGGYVCAFCGILGIAVLGGKSAMSAKDRLDAIYQSQMAAYEITQ